MLSFDHMLQTIDTIISQDFEQKGTIECRAALITSDDVIFHPLNWEDDEGKALAFARLKKHIETLMPARYAIVGEAWKAPWPEHPALLRASKSDQRVEIAYVFLVDRSGKNCLATRPIERPHWQRDSKPRLGPVTFDLNMEGEFANLFDKQGGTNGRRSRKVR
jgi:hypothetical protein